MEKRQMLILCKIGTKDITNKSITDIKVDRNFSDVGNKFSIELVDSPEVMTYDLELYMNAGYRNIDFKYGDLSTNKLTSYKGTIWDYTNTFVGNKKKLTITGICDRYTGSNDGPATWLYNIDWNSYFNKRENEGEPYGAITSENLRLSLSLKTSAILNSRYRNSLLTNSKKLKLTGPSKKTIEIPIPDSFFIVDSLPENPDNVNNIDKDKFPEFYSVVKDPDNKFWGVLHTEKTTNESVVNNLPGLTAAHTIYYKDEKPVACIINEKYGNGHRDVYYLNIQYVIEYDKSVFMEADKLLNVPDGWIIMGQTNTKLPGISGPLRDTIETINGNEYYIIKDKNNSIVGFSTSRMTSSNNDIFVKVIPDFWVEKPLAKNIFKNLVKRAQETVTQEIEDKTRYIYYYDKDNKLRGFIDTKEENGNINYSALYIQANPNSSNFGGAGILKSGAGVNISSIVKQLAILEGWKLFYDKDGNTPYIVQTEMVPNSDAFIMQGQSAFEFIQKNLIPKSVTPVGNYVNSSGVNIAVNKPQGGFGLFFDKDGYVHYQPISQTNLEDLGIQNLGYNIPGTPTISFQINTKGTAFYNWQNTTINTTVITSGVEVSEVEVISEETAEEIKNTKGHNDTFDAWLGLNYETVQNAVERAKSDSFISRAGLSISGNNIQEVAYGLAQNALVSKPTTKLSSSGVYNSADVSGNIAKAIKNIQDFTITANMNMWGDYRIKPAGIITINNMITGGINNSNIPQKHPSSGKYLIQKVSESISASNYIQSLDLIRFTEDLNKLINPYKIDYSKGASPFTEDVETLPADESIDNVTQQPSNNEYPASEYNPNNELSENNNKTNYSNNTNTINSRIPTNNSSFKNISGKGF